jgi:hypothetical protein
MHLVFRLNTKVELFLLGGAICVWAQMPPGPGREETQRVCSGCHELERSISLRQDRDGWKATINKMVGLGAQGTEQELSAALDYLSQNYPAKAIPRLNVNTKSIDELKKVPGIDPAKIEANKDVLIF